MLDKITAFLDELQQTSEVYKAAKHYEMTEQQIVNALKRRLVVNRFRDKEIKRIAINFTDVPSQLTFKLTKVYTK